MCKQCENFKGFQTVLHSLPKLFDPLLDPPSADADDAPDGDDDGESEVDGWAGKAALLNLLSFCKLPSKSDMVKRSLCAGAFDGPGKEACINGTCSRCGFKTLWSASLRKHVVDKDGNVLASAPKEFQSEVKWIRIRSSKSTSPGEAKQPTYESKTGTLVQFLDDFERDVMRKFPHHRFTVARQKAMAAEFNRNRGPGWIQSDVDFAMDGTIPPPRGRSIQSDHWSPMSYTLFIQVISWLESAAWKSRNSKLDLNCAVTIEPADASEPDSIIPAKGSCYAEVMAVPSATERAATDPEQLRYGVRRHGASDDDPLEYVERRYLRHRKLHTKAFVHVSNDKTHDSYAAQTFINKTIDYLEEQYVRPGTETFFAWHMHSDNAPSHFKSSKTMNYVTKLPARLKDWAMGVSGADGKPLTFRVFWEFGAPGHGKGVWDGIGAWIKRTVRQAWASLSLSRNSRSLSPRLLLLPQDIVDHRPEMKTVLTADEQILSPEQVAEHVKARFNTDEFVQSHLKKTINEVVVSYTPTAEIIRPVGQDFESMPGMKKTFLFMPVREGVTLQRPFACWCDACMQASAPGEGTMDSNYRCHGCSSPGLRWRETSVARSDAAGVASSKARTRQLSRSLRDQLKAHFAKSTNAVWVAVQNRGEDDPDQYWIGRAVALRPPFQTGGSVAGTGGRVRYDPGDMEIEVEWFDRDVSGGDERRIFKAWRPGADTTPATAAAVGRGGSGGGGRGRGGGRRGGRGAAEAGAAAEGAAPEGPAVLTFNSSELRMINVEMQLVAPLGGGAALDVVRRSGRVALQGIARRVQTQRADPPDQLWEIPTGNERFILDRCS